MLGEGHGSPEVLAWDPSKGSSSPFQRFSPKILGIFGKLLPKKVIVGQFLAEFEGSFFLARRFAPD